MTISDDLLDIYVGRATGGYGLASVNQLQHALQAATLSEKAGDPPSLIVAALLHDVGHMIHDLGENPASAGIDDRHEDAGAEWLAAWFPPAVVEPVRLHVAAKRYLCAVEPSYFGTLSRDSIRSLALQGGPMSTDEVAGFDRLEWAEGATKLRRYDEAAKDPAARTRSFEYFLRYVGTCRGQALVAAAIRP